MLRMRMHYRVLVALPYYSSYGRLRSKLLCVALGMPDRLDDDPALAEAGSVGPTPVVGRPVAQPRPETVRLYAADWLDFSSWCRVNGCQALPSSTETLSAYLLAVAPGLSRGALGRRRAAIGRMHRLHSLLVPRLDAPARASLRRAARRHPASQGAAIPDASALTRAALTCPRDLAGLRDRALLLLVVAAGTLQRRRHDESHAGIAVTRQALLTLTREQVRFVEAGLAIDRRDGGLAVEAGLAIGRRDGGLEPEPPLIVARARTESACPVRAMEDWLRASETTFGPVFRKVDRWDNVEHAGLAPDGLRRIVAHRSGSRRPRRASPGKNA